MEEDKKDPKEETETKLVDKKIARRGQEFRSHLRKGRSDGLGQMLGDVIKMRAEN